MTSVYLNCISHFLCLIWFSDFNFCFPRGISFVFARNYSFGFNSVYFSFFSTSLFLFLCVIFLFSHFPILHPVKREMYKIDVVEMNSDEWNFHFLTFQTFNFQHFSQRLVKDEVYFYFIGISCCLIYKQWPIPSVTACVFYRNVFTVVTIELLTLRKDCN